MAGRTPDFKLKVLSKATNKTCYCGAAWKNEDGSVSIQLDLTTVLSGTSDFVISLFPNTKTFSGPKQTVDKAPF